MRIGLILSLYDEFMSGGRIVREKFCKENFISERTLYRYLNDIRDHLRRRKSGCVISYSKEDECYFLEELPENGEIGEDAVRR